MASFDFAALTAPLSASDPCGPDLDLEGDPVFMQFVARSDGFLPASFFTRDEEGRQTVFDRTSIDFPGEFKTLASLLETTRDLRLLTVQARLLALHRDLAGFSACLTAVAALLSERWEAVHPRGEDGDYGFRAAILQSLDDMPTVILPLQHLPLVDSRRFGAISFRSVMVATGEAGARDDETAPDRAGVERAFAEADQEALAATRDRFRAIRDAAGAIHAVTIERAGYAQAVNLERVAALAGRVLGVLDPVLGGAEPGVAPAPDEAAEAGETSVGAERLPAVSAGSIASAGAAARALAAASAYFARHEPSSPSALLVRQAELLRGKSFVEVMRALVPNYADQARLAVGPRPDQSFDLMVERLEAPDPSDLYAGEAGPDGEAQPASPEVGNRQGAVSLLRQVSAFYRAAEPSSPIPLLLDRASSLVERDFLSLLKDVLPGVTLSRRDD